MGVISVMKRFVHLLAEGGETIFPTFFPSEVGVVGVELELYTYVINHRLFERTIQKMVSGGKVIWVHVSSF